MLINEPATQVLLDALIDALLRDEDWRELVEGPLDSEVERLMLIAEQIHDAAGDTPTAGARQKLRVWDRLIRRGDGPTSHSRLLTLRGFTGARQPRLAHRGMGATGLVPGHIDQRGRAWL